MVVNMGTKALRWGGFMCLRPGKEAVHTCSWEKGSEVGEHRHKGPSTM